MARSRPIRTSLRAMLAAWISTVLTLTPTNAEALLIHDHDQHGTHGHWVELIERGADPSLDERSSQHFSASAPDHHAHSGASDAQRDEESGHDSTDAAAGLVIILPHHLSAPLHQNQTITASPVPAAPSAVEATVGASSVGILASWVDHRDRFHPPRGIAGLLQHNHALLF